MKTGKYDENDNENDDNVIVLMIKIIMIRKIDNDDEVYVASVFWKMTENANVSLSLLNKFNTRM